MTFSVTLRTADGTETTRTVEAESRAAVYGLMEQEGARVIDIQERSGGGPLSSLMRFQIGTGIKTEDRIGFAKNLSSMLSAGLPLSRALSVIGRQSHNRYFTETVTAVDTRVKGGSSFHEALALFPRVFSPLFVAMAKAGEEGGTLARTLKVISVQMDAAHTLRKKVRGAMLYPAIILFAIVVIAVLMLIYVVPTLARTFASLNTELPFATRAILGVSNLLLENGLLVAAALLAVSVIGFFLARSRSGKRGLMILFLHVPVIGTLVRETYAARTARTLSSLLSSGVEMLTALGITAEVAGDTAFGDVVREAQEDVRRGEALSAQFVRHSALYPLFFSEMILVGEETGTVADMLSQVAEYYEAEVEARTKDLSALIEPILMLFVGVAVGVFALAMVAPIYSISQAI